MGKNAQIEAIMLLLFCTKEMLVVQFTHSDTESINNILISLLVNGLVSSDASVFSSSADFPRNSQAEQVGCMCGKP